MHSITDTCSAIMMRRVRRTEVVVVPLLGKEMTAPTLSPFAPQATNATMAASALISDVLARLAESDTRADLVLNNCKTPTALRSRTRRSRALQSRSPYRFLRCWLWCFSWFEENVRACPCFHLHLKFTRTNRLTLVCDSRVRVSLRGSLRFVIPTIHSRHRLLPRAGLPRTGLQAYVSRGHLDQNASRQGACKRLFVWLKL